MGTASVDALAAHAPTVPQWATDAIVLDDVELVQAMFEIPSATRQELLPPSLHPTNPATMVFQAWRCGSSPWGAFSLVQVRVQCRSGLRPRGLVVGAACDNEGAAAALAARYGIRSTPSAITIRRYYDEAVVEVGDALLLRGEDPEPLDVGDVSYSSTLALAHTPNGVRLVQLDLTPDLVRAERATPLLERFDPSAWGTPLLDPRHPVSASIGVGRATLPAVRYCCKPDTLAFDGTETVGSATPGS